MNNIIENEIWKWIPNFENLYQISNFGRLKSFVRKTKTLKLSSDKDGYLKASLKSKTHKVHYLVAITFIGEKPEGDYTVNHINGIKNDNRVENLEWKLRKENLKHAFDNGLINLKGQNNNNAKLTDENIIEIKNLLSEKKLKQFEIAQKFGVSQTTISDIKHNKLWS